MSSGSSWVRGATPAASVGPVGAGVAGRVGFGAGRGEWIRDEAAAGRALDLVNGNVWANVAATRYPPSSATAATAAISPRLRPDHELLGPPEDGWGGGQDCPGGGPAGGQDCAAAPAGVQGCCGSEGCQNWPGGRCGAGAAGLTCCGRPGGTAEVYGRTWYPRAWAYSEATHRPAAGSIARRSDSALATSCTAVS